MKAKKTKKKPAKAKAKAKGRAPAKAKKLAKKPAAKKKVAKARKPAAKKAAPKKAKSAGVPLLDLFKLQPVAELAPEQVEAENHELWKHKKELPPHDTAKQQLKPKLRQKIARPKSGGFGSRHH